MDLSEEPRFQVAPSVPTRLDNLAQHPLGVIIRVLAAGAAIFFGGVSVVMAVFNYSFQRPPEALWNQRLLESLTVAILGLTVAISILITAWRPTPRRLLATVLVLLAAPLLGRAL